MLRALLQRMIGYYPMQGVLLTDETAGVPLVTASNAIMHTPVWRAVNLIATDLARIDCEIDNPVADALVRMPNRWMSGFEFRRTMTLHCATYGNAFALINRTVGGELIDLMPMDPDSVSLDLTGEEPVYRTRAYGTLPLDRMFHVRCMGWNGLWGEAPTRVCRTALTVMAAQEQSQLKSMENAGQPKLALVHPGALNDKQRQMIAEDYMRRHAGSVNAGRPVVLGDNMRVERIGSTFDNDGIDAARRYSVQDVSRIFGVPVSYLSEHSTQPYGSMEWLGRMYVDHCMRHWAAMWTSEIRSKLADEFTGVSWDFDELSRPGIAEQMAALRTGVEAGIITRNEARDELDLPPLEGLDAPTLALNMGAGGGTTNIGTDTSAKAGTPNDF